MSKSMDKGHNSEFSLLNDRMIHGGESMIAIDSLINTTKASFAAIKSLKENCWVKLT
jgi:hypothetical protein